MLLNFFTILFKLYYSILWDVEKNCLTSKGVKFKHIMKMDAQNNGLHKKSVVHIVIRNFLANINTYGMKKSPGRPKKLSSRSERRILAELTNSQKGVRQVRNEIAADVSHVTVWRVAQNSPNVVRQSLRACPNLTDAHKQARIRFAENHITWTHQWNTVVLRVFSLCSIGLKIVFSDEKRFCLDGPDGVHSYWRDLRKDPSIFAKRPMGVEGLWFGLASQYLGIQK